MLSIRLDHWIQSHPLIQWLISHPLGAIGLGLLSLFLLTGLLSAIGRLGEQLWLRLLRSPIALLSSITRNLSSRIQQIRPTAKPDRLTEILDRLEILRQEETVLMEEMRQLVKKGSKGIGD
jgi:hypothetical protein